MASCVFFEHRDAPTSLRSVLIDTTEMLYLEHDVRTFMVGGYGNFDRMAESAVRECKKKYPHMELLLITAYLNRFRSSGLEYDGIIYPEGLESVPQRFAITHRNRWMAERADYIVAYVGTAGGGAAKALALGRKRLPEDRIINLYGRG